MRPLGVDLAACCSVYLGRIPRSPARVLHCRNIQANRRLAPAPDAPFSGRYSWRGGGGAPELSGVALAPAEVVHKRALLSTLARD